MKRTSQANNGYNTKNLSHNICPMQLARKDNVFFLKNKGFEVFFNCSQDDFIPSLAGKRC
jgi:hypothetical protein